ncbi:MAG: hypothetical protein ACREJX_03945, partial [Polyangiaceae bacterium]
LYADDARVPEPLHVVATTSLSYTDTGASPTRADSPFGNSYNAFAANTAQPGAMMAFGGEVGLVSHLSVIALGEAGAGEGAAVNAGALAGLRLQLLPIVWKNTHLVMSAGYLREAWEGPVHDDDGKWYPGSPRGDNGAWGQLAFSGDVRRLRIATTIHGEHIFADGKDDADVMVNAGASYRLVGDFRAGVEYVGQDLEETFDPGAEGGARHFVGPVASLQLLQHRLSIVAGPAIGLSSTSPRLLGRLAVAYGF